MGVSAKVEGVDSTRNYRADDYLDDPDVLGQARIEYSGFGRPSFTIRDPADRFVRLRLI